MQVASNKTDTIAAIATAAGSGGIGVVRVSGPAAQSIATEILGHCPKPRYAAYLPFLDADDQLIDRGGADRRMNYHHVAVADGDLRHRCEIAIDVEWQLGYGERQDHEAAVHHAQCVSVGRCPGARLARDDPVGTRAVLDYDLLLQDLRHALGDETGADVGHAAR